VLRREPQDMRNTPHEGWSQPHPPPPTDRQLTTPLILPQTQATFFTPTARPTTTMLPFLLTTHTFQVMHVMRCPAPQPIGMWNMADDDGVCIASSLPQLTPTTDTLTHVLQAPSPTLQHHSHSTPNRAIQSLPTSPKSSRPLMPSISLGSRTSQATDCSLASWNAHTYETPAEAVRR
jgi:hypothetical protein